MINDVDNKNMNIYYDCIICKKEKEKYKQNINNKLNHTRGQSDFKPKFNSQKIVFIKF